MNNLDIKNMQEKLGNIPTHESKLTVGGEDGPGALDLYCTLKLDGEEIASFKSESFLQSFAYQIAAFFHGGDYRKLGPTSTPADSLAYNFNLEYQNYWEISSHVKQSPLRINLASTQALEDHFNDYNQADPNYVIMTGCSDSAFNGVYRGVKIDNNTLELYDLDDNPVDGSAAGVLDDGYCIPNIGYNYGSVKDAGYNEFVNGVPYNTYNPYMLQIWQVIVGTSSQPVSIDDMYLWDRIMPGSGDGQLSHGTVSYSTLVTDKPTSRFTLSKPFTNQGSTDVTVNEIGIISGPGNDTSSGPPGQNGTAVGLLQVRDVLGSSVLIPSGSTLTVDYELVVRLQPDTQDTDTDGSNGGFLQEFMARLRSFASAGTYTQEWGEYFFCCKPPGLTNPKDYNQDTNFGRKLLGIRLGDNDQFTSMTDAGLNIPDGNKNGYEHGEEDGELFHWGTHVEDVIVDKPNNKASFEIVGIFENRGTVSLPVREKGLWCIDSTNNDTSRMFARMALDNTDEFTIGPGEFHKVKFIVEVQA